MWTSSGTVTYQALIDAAISVAQQLRQRDIQRLGVVVDRSLENYAAIMACLLVGCCYVPLNAQLPAERLEAIRSEARLSAQFDPAWLSEPLSDTFERSPVIPDQLVYLLFTSGSTGVPKGVPIQYQQLDAFISMMQRYHALVPSDRVAQHASLSFDMSVYDLYMAWHAGASLYVVPESQRIAPLQFIKEHAITVWFSVPSVIKTMRQLKLLPPNAMPSLRLSLFSGEPLEVGDALAWQAAAPDSAIDNLYGPTEATVECCGYRFDATQAWPDEAAIVPLASHCREIDWPFVLITIGWMIISRASYG